VDPQACHAHGVDTGLGAVQPHGLLGLPGAVFILSLHGGIVGFGSVPSGRDHSEAQLHPAQLLVLLLLLLPLLLLVLELLLLWSCWLLRLLLQL
jgi:hypothetical protein